MCGIFGVYNHLNASRITYYGLYGLQHRGQESCGIVSVENNEIFHRHRGMGSVNGVFDDVLLSNLKGTLAIGHVRYSTSGDKSLHNAQPFIFEVHNEKISLCHNGNITNYEQLKEKLSEEGSVFTTNSDTEVIIHLISRSKQKTIESRIEEAVSKIEGAYSLIFLFKDKMIAVRDAKGYRPLSIGRKGSSWIITSETCIFELLEYKLHMNVQPGQMITINDDGLAIQKILQEEKKGCAFEYIYFSRPDSFFDDISVYKTRIKIGMFLAKKYQVDADAVIPVPDSGIVSAIGYSEQCKIPFTLGLIRNHYVGRTFIKPKQNSRDRGVKLKLSTVGHVIKNKKVILVDDSLVRGTTCKNIVNLVRAAGAKEIHVRISSPRVVAPCYYGIDIPTKEELIANNLSKQGICEYIGADTLEYIEIEDLKNILGREHCFDCFDKKTLYQIRN